MDRDGCYILRAYLPPEQMPESLGSNNRRCCGRGTHSGFTLRKRSLALKSDLGLRPIHHPIEKRVETHIFVAFLAYCLTVTLLLKLELSAPGFTPVAVPSLAREAAFVGTGHFPGSREEAYQLEDDLFLAGTSEVGLNYLRSGEILSPLDLPVRDAGFSSCFRRQAGAAGQEFPGPPRAPRSYKFSQ